MRFLTRRGPWIAVFALLVGAAPIARAGGKPEERAPGPASKGEIYSSKSSDGLPFYYYVPKGYDPKVGANLTFILHGSNLDRGWGFANHEAGAFRPDDVVVCPDGTTSNGQGGHNFLQSDKDLKRLHALHDDLKKAFKVRATFVYGHSQGSFFAFYYAGAYPDDVQGVLGQASGTWIGTEATAKHHHQAVALMHGTADPVVGYGQSVGGLDFYLQAKYPILHLRSLENWNHWPNQDQAAQELAWCEGMTSAEPARVVASYEHLVGVKEWHDWSVLYQVAKRLSDLEGAPGDARKKASETAAAVDRLGKKNVDAIAKSLGKEKGDKIVDAPWVALLPTFLRDFEGVPSAGTLEATLKDRFEKQQTEAQKNLREYYRVREKDPAKAFDAGVEAVRVGFLYWECADGVFLDALAKGKDDKKLKLSKASLKAYDQVVVPFVAARASGLKEFLSLNKSLD